jgi:dipeptide/tripeptide permease
VAQKHPAGLYRLFFTEMWERLAFYTMLNILLLYTTDSERGGLGLTSAEGNEIYGLYLAFVYFTPFPGGMLADRYLGYRKAVLIGAVFMSGGLFLMSIPGSTYFITGLVGLIIGNGFFKPNISVMVGNLYEAGDPKRDAGFNIFYMGINIGAFVASFLSSAVRNSAGWLWTFRVAAIGLLIAMVVLLLSWKVLEKADRRPEQDPNAAGFGAVFGKILLPALGAGLVGFLIGQNVMPDGPVRPAVLGFLVGMIPVVIFFVRMGTTASPKERPGLQALLPIYVAGGTFFMILHLNGSAMTQWARDNTDRTGGVAAAEAAGDVFSTVFFTEVKFTQEGLPSYYPNAGPETPRPDPRSLLAIDDKTAAAMYGQQKLNDKAVAAIAGASAEVVVKEIPLDDKGPLSARSATVYPDVTIETSDDGHGGSVTTAKVPDGAKPSRRVAFVREVDGEPLAVYVVEQALFSDIYDGYRERFEKEPELLAPGTFVTIVSPELYQSFNALFVVAFTPLVVMLFGRLSAAGIKISTAQKVFWGLVLTTGSMVLMAVAGLMSDGGALKVSGMWLVGFYGVVTIGELLLSPMGLSLVTKLTPGRLVGLAMGGWFMATAFGNNLSGFFGGIQGSLSPVSFFLVLAGLAGASALFIRVLLPRLDKTLSDYGA